MSRYLSKKSIRGDLLVSGWVVREHWYQRSLSQNTGSQKEELVWGKGEEFKLGYVVVLVLVGHPCELHSQELETELLG